MPVLDFAPYRKTVLAVIGAVLAWSQQVISSAPDHITAGEWRTLAVLVLMAAGVYGATNDNSVQVNQAIEKVYEEINVDGHPGNPFPKDQ